MLPEHIETPFGFALAPLQLAAARQHTAQLSSKHGSSSCSHEELHHLEPQYLETGYRPHGWHRTLHLVPAAAPRSSYSHPLAGGDARSELPAGTYQDLVRDPKLAETLPFFQDRVPPQSGAFRIGDDTEGKQPVAEAQPTLIWERLVPERPSKRADAKVMVAAHGLGFCKETWLPLLDRLVTSSQDGDHGIAEVWLVDALGHGMTAVYNASTIRSTDAQTLLSCHHRIVDSNDYARDLLQFLTCYLPGALNLARRGSDFPTVLPFSRPSLPSRPIIGLGHSFGATALLQVGVHLPDVFESICVVEPILVREALVEKASRIPLARFTLLKQDEWPSRSAASEAFAKDRMLSAWDARVRSAFVAGGLFPTSSNASSKKLGEVTQDSVQRCCNRVSEALCIRGNRPGIQLATHTLRHLPSRIKVLYISCAKPLLLPRQEVESTARSNIPNLVFETIEGSHSLPQELPDAIADSISRSLLSSEQSLPFNSVSSKL